MSASRALRADDGCLVALAGVHAVLLLTYPSVLLIACGVWWTSNTVSHNFIHNPFFRRPSLNRAFAGCLSLLLGFPQSVWRERHLAHHAGRAPRLRFDARVATESALVAALWVTVAVLAPTFLLLTYLPGLALGLALCHVQGLYEHRNGATVSHYGALYNLLFFNDGYHVEHHARPSAHWRELPKGRTDERGSRWPPILRFFERPLLDRLEVLALGSERLAGFVLGAHERAFRRLRPVLGTAESVAIVGGGLFPRTALILNRLVPHARLVVIDEDAGNLSRAREAAPELDVDWVRARFDPALHAGFDMVVVPLAYRGDRSLLYENPPADVLVVHDWLWRPRGSSTVVSIGLLKRINVVHR